MGACGSKPEAVNTEYQQLLGKCWYFPSYAITNFNEVNADVEYWGPGGKKGEGGRPLSMFLLDPAPEAPRQTAVVVNKPRRAVEVYDGIMAKPLGQFNMEGVSDDKIAHLVMNGVNVGFALGFTSGGVEFGLDKREEHSKGSHKAKFVVVVQLYSLSINLQTIERKQEWVRSITVQDLVRDGLDPAKYGCGIVTSVVFGGVMMLEMDQKNYEEMRNSFGGNVKLSGGLQGVEAQLGVYRNNETGKQRFSCRVKTNGGRKPSSKDMINIDAAGLLEMVKEYVTKLEEHPHEAVPLRLTVTKYDSFITTVDRFLPSQNTEPEKKIVTDDEPAPKPVDHIVVTPRKIETVTDQEPPKAEAPPLPQAEIQPVTPSPSPPSRPVTPQPKVEPSFVPQPQPQPVLPPPAAEPAPAPVPQPQDAEGQQNGANFVFATQVLLPKGDAAFQEELLLDNLRGAVKFSNVAAAHHEYTLDLYSCRDWLTCAAAVFAQPNCVYHLDLHDVDMEDWQARVLAAVLEGSAHTNALQDVTLTGNFAVQESGLTAVLDALESIGNRRAQQSRKAAPTSLKLHMNGVARTPLGKALLEKSNQKVKFVSLHF